MKTTHTSPPNINSPPLGPLTSMGARVIISTNAEMTGWVDNGSMAHPQSSDFCPNKSLSIQDGLYRDQGFIYLPFQQLSNISSPPLLCLDRVRLIRPVVHLVPAGREHIGGTLAVYSGKLWQRPSHHGAVQEPLRRWRSHRPGQLCNCVVLALLVRRVLRHKCPPVRRRQRPVQPTENPAVLEKRSLLADDLPLLLGALHFGLEVAAAGGTDGLGRERARTTAETTLR